MYGKTGYATKQEYDHARYLRLKQERESKKQPHPITKLTEVERAYIAGLIDGEGAIYCAHVRNTWYPTISIFMTSEGVLRWLAKKTGAQKVHTCRRKDTWRYKSVLKTQYLFRMSGKSAQLLCKAILPYMRIKANHAHVVCAFPIEGRTAPGARIEENVINGKRRQLTRQLEALNDNRYRRRHSQS